MLATGRQGFWKLESPLNSLRRLLIWLHAGITWKLQLGVSLSRSGDKLTPNWSFQVIPACSQIKSLLNEFSGLSSFQNPCRPVASIVVPECCHLPTTHNG